MIGSEDIIQDRRRDSTVRAHTEVYTLKIEKETLERIFEEYPDIKYDLIKRATKRDAIMRFHQNIRDE
jgi:CRP-like cAMP-binding protein